MCLCEYREFSGQMKAIFIGSDTPGGGIKVSDDPPKSIIRLQSAIEIRGKLIESTSVVENHFERI